MKISTKHLGTFEWSNKPVISKRSIGSIGFLISLLYLGFRLRPYLIRDERVVPFVGSRAAGAGSSDPEKERMRAEIAKHTITGTVNPLARIQKAWGSGIHSSGGSFNTQRVGSAGSNHLVERPLLDGISVVLQAILARPWASNEGDTAIEARVVGAFAPSALSNIDYTTVQGATLLGQAQANLDTHRVEVRFNELRTADGKRYSVASIALGPDGQSQGIPAHYSSGFAPRILGAAMGEVISAADTVATARILQNVGDDTLATHEASQLISRTSGQAGSELGQEATKDLKATRAVLSVDGGTAFTVKLQATTGGTL